MRTIICLFIALSTISCTRIVFDVPQPRDVAAFTEFPERFQGKYITGQGTHDSILIEAKTVTFTELIEKEISTIRMDTMQNISLKGGLIYDHSVPELGGLPFVIEDTLLKYSYVGRHTVGLSDSVVIKELGSSLIANTSFADDETDYWDIYILNLSGDGSLTVSSVGNLKTPDSDEDEDYDADIDDFARIVPYERISEDTYLFRPNKKQFQKLVDKNLFSNTETYQRVH